MRKHMTFDNILAVITAIVGLPTTIAFYWGGQAVVAVLILLLVAGVVGGVFLHRWHTNRPIVTFMSHEKTLTFEDKDAHTATHLSKIRVRANHNGLQRFRVGRANGHGELKNILIDGQPATDTEDSLDGIELYKVFRPPLAYHEERDVQVSLTCIDTFKGNSHRWTKRLRLRRSHRL